jgi:hypothetical protein
MCQRVTCKNCDKATYQGCGMHVEQVLAGVASADRCSCGEPGAQGGLLSRLFGSRRR